MGFLFAHGLYLPVLGELGDIRLRANAFIAKIIKIKAILPCLKYFHVRLFCDSIQVNKIVIYVESVVPYR